MESLLLTVLFGVVVAIVPAHIAHTKGRNALLWFFYGFLLGPLAWVHSFLINANGNAEGYTVCKYCTGVVKSSAVKCMHCGSDLNVVVMREGVEGTSHLTAHTSKEYHQIINSEPLERKNAL